MGVTSDKDKGKDKKGKDREVEGPLITISGGGGGGGLKEDVFLQAADNDILAFPILPIIAKAVKVILRAMSKKAVKKSVTTTAKVGTSLKLKHETLQHMFSRHSKDFGIKGNGNKSLVKEFEGVIQNHINLVGDGS